MNLSTSRIMMMSALIITTERLHQCLVLLQKVVMIGRRRLGRNQAENIAEIPIILAATTLVTMNLHRALPHPAHQVMIAHPVMIAGPGRSTARGVEEIGMMIDTGLVIITIGTTAAMNIVQLNPPSPGIKPSLNVLWKLTSESSCHILILQ